MSAVKHWPLFGLRVSTPRLDLRYPNDDDIAEIAERSAIDGVHDPSFMPFTIEWTDVPPPLQQRLSMQHHWSVRANWKPTHWTCNLAVVVDDRIVGTQAIIGEDFSQLRSVHSGSFLFRSEQGKGIGTEMRAAILHLAFAGLGAAEARTAAWGDNEQSLGVTRKLGYEPIGRRWKLSRGLRREMVEYRLERDAWEAHRRDDIAIIGLEPCLDLFGLNDVTR